MSKVSYERRGSVAEITLNRPDKLNAIDEEVLEGLESALERAAGDDDIRAVLLRGEGRAFSAGFDLGSWSPREGESREDSVRRELRRDFDFIMQVWDFEKPLIVAAQGYCLGSSLEVSAMVISAIARTTVVSACPRCASAAVRCA